MMMACLEKIKRKRCGKDDSELCRSFGKWELGDFNLEKETDSLWCFSKHPWIDRWPLFFAFFFFTCSSISSFASLYIYIYSYAQHCAIINIYGNNNCCQLLYVNNSFGCNFCSVVSKVSVNFYSYLQLGVGLCSACINSIKGRNRWHVLFLSQINR